MNMGSRKIGPNEKCPCGSGKKFKKCCRDKQPIPIPSNIFERAQAAEHQRQLQQGLGRPIIAEELKGCQFVAVGSQLFYSNRWKTFHDFLLHYIKIVLGGEWGDKELKKPAVERHPLLNWYHDVTVYLNSQIKTPGVIATTHMTGLVRAYVSLAYSLYLLAHNLNIQERLIRRLKDRDQFYGAYYEAFVMGALIRAGFAIELEDESDTTTSHCELTATFRQTGVKFSVEAKTRLAKKRSANVGNQLYEALRKRAKHPRIVFIEVNAEGNGTRESQVKILHDVLASIRSREATLTIEGQPAPPAYVIATNNPHGAVDCAYEASAMMEGFKISDYKCEGAYATLREALDSRERHAPIEALAKSLAEHSHIPATFNGEVSPFAFNKSDKRLLIGQRYVINTANGEVAGKLTHAHVLDGEKQAFVVLHLDDGQNVIGYLPLSDAELEAYRASPQTFFGVLQQKPKLNNPLEIYDWIYENYRHNTKDQFLKLLADAPDIVALSCLEQPELAKILAERWTQAILVDSRRVTPPDNRM